MERNNILLSFKGAITSELLTSVLQIIENKMELIGESPKTKKKVFNVLVECLQNLYHHIDDFDIKGSKEEISRKKSAIFMISRKDGVYRVITGNFIDAHNTETLSERIDYINSLDKEELKSHYKAILNNGEISAKGGGGLGFIDIARKSGQKLEYDFMDIEEEFSFFTLIVKIEQKL